MKKIIIALAAILLIVEGVVLLRIPKDRRKLEQDQDRQERISAYNAAMDDLWQKRRQLEQELRDYETVIASAGQNHASLVLLFAEPDLRLEENVIPTLTKDGCTGTIALTEEDLNDAERCLSHERLAELQSAGWDLCLSATAATDLSALADAVKDAGLKPAKTLYLPDGILTESQSAAAQELGISAVIQHSGTVDGELSYHLPCITATGSRESLVSPDRAGLSVKLLSEAVERSGGIVLTTGYRRLRDTFDAVNFRNMLSSINAYRSDGKLEVTDAITAWTRMTEADKLAEEADGAEVARMEQCRRELAEVNGQIAGNLTPETP